VPSLVFKTGMYPSGPEEKKNGSRKTRSHRKTGEGVVGCRFHPRNTRCILVLKRGYKYLSFMNAYSSYNQIPMHPEDQEKTAFITDMGVYCYTMTPSV
jgi:hypothetical protein